MMELNVYLSRDKWQPEAICIERGVDKGIEFGEEFTLFSSGMLSFVNVYMDSTGEAHADSLSILLSDGKIRDEYLLYNPPCSRTPALKGNLSYTTNEEEEQIAFSFPRLAFSGFDKYTLTMGGNTSFVTPPSIGEIVRRTPDYTGKTPETFTCSFSEKAVAPGETVSVAFNVLGSQEEILYRVNLFETPVWTSGIVVGCGLFDGESFYEGGEGTSFDEDVHTNVDLHWAIEFNGRTFAVRPSDFTVYGLGERVAIVKKGLKGNTLSTGKASSASVRDELDSDDLIVPFSFYGHSQ